MKHAVGGCLAILIIISIVMMLLPGTATSAVTYKLDSTTFSQRYCPSGYQSMMRGYLPQYRGGPSGQLLLNCVPLNQPIVEEHLPFMHNPRAPFDRIRQDPYVMMYNG